MRKPSTALLVVIGLTAVLAAAILVWQRGSDREPTPRPVPSSSIPAPAAASRPTASGAGAPPPAAASAGGATEPQDAPSDDTAAPSVLPEVLLGLGSEAFVAKDFETARRHFRAIVDASPDHPMAPYAAYKLGWCEFNLDDPKAAVVELERVVGWLRDDGRPEEAVTLREALMDLEHFAGQVDSGG